MVKYLPLWIWPNSTYTSKDIQLGFLSFWGQYFYNNLHSQHACLIINFTFTSITLEYLSAVCQLFLQHKLRKFLHSRLDWWRSSFLAWEVKAGLWFVLVPGRASSSQIIDVFITLLQMGSNGYKKLVNERRENFALLKQEMSRLAPTIHFCPGDFSY